MPALISQKLSGYEISHRDISLNALVLWCTRKALANASAFFSEIQSEMHFVREILLRNVKYACGV